MKQQTVRTTVDIPAGLYRRLKVRAAAKGCSARELILVGIRQALAKEESPAAKRVHFPLLDSEGPVIDLTNEQMYDIIEFP
jgi:plasmid stability protein